MMKIDIPRTWLRPIIVLVSILSCLVSCSPSESTGQDALEKIQLPPGFSIEILIPDVPNARAMALSPNQVLYVGTRTEGKVYAIDLTKKPYQVQTIASGLNLPVGVAWQDGDLYVSEVSRILRYKGIDNHLLSPPKPEIVNDSFPQEQHHGWKFIAFGPDGKLYVPVGAPCNICLKEDKRFASIMRMDKDGSNLEVFAEGVRNTVGFDWHPETQELWFTDNGRDWLGDDFPPDELNRAPKQGMHFGYPYCHGGDIVDPKFGHLSACYKFTKPEVKLGPHVAALGMRFYTHDLFPKKYQQRIFIAEHGSWNRSTPIGYRITMVDPAETEKGYEIFAEGWLQGDKAWGRPVDVLVMPDGAMLVSDDYKGVIYRITYRE